MRSIAVTGACIAIALVTRGERVRACAGGEWDIAEDTTFDPNVVGEWAGLAWDPAHATYGGACDDCIDKARIADWLGYLPGVTAADWKKVLIEATDAELAQLRAKVKSGGAAPRKFATSSLWKVTAQDHLLAALDYVRFARKAEPFLLLDDGYGNRPPQAPPVDLLKQAKAGIAHPDPFLAQRYAFQAVRIAFYQRDWAMAIATHDTNAAVLAKPSTEITWNARHYLAGALLRGGKRGRANLELARIAIEYPPLAGQAVFEFAPKDDADWREALRLATSVKDKVALWRVAGIRKDGLVGAREVLALDPKSPYAALLMVRELTKLEEKQPYVSSNGDPKEVAAQAKALAAIEKLALDQIQKNADRPWLMELVAGHISAIRGDLPTTRARMGRALAAQPRNARVISQVNASLAIAISRNWKVGDPRIETELATAIAQITSEFDRRGAVTDEVRERLAPLYLKAGKPSIAELLHQGAATPHDDANTPRVKSPWRDLNFIKDLMARETGPKTPFEQFVAAGTYSKDDLQFEIAMRLLFDGDFAGAKATFDPKRSQKLSQDPFVLKIRDSYDADRAKYRGTWTYASVLARLVDLDAKVKAGGESGAEAAMLIGNAIYNSTQYGISKWMAEPSHAGTGADAELAVRYFKKAHDLSTNRELKTKAAFFAAKAEMIVRMDEPLAPDTDLAPPLAKTWYPILKSYKGTRFYKDVIKECGRFAAWAK